MIVVMRNCSRGSAALGVILAVSLGMFITLSVGNFSHYITARNALENAARITARCISPTDAGCAEYKSPEYQTRYRYFAMTTSPRSDQYGERVRYTARMFRTRYQTQSEYYSIEQEEQPRVRLESYRVPLDAYRVTKPMKVVTVRTGYDLEFPLRVTVSTVDPSFPSWNDEAERTAANSSFSSYVSNPFFSSGDKALRNEFEVIFQERFNIENSGSGETVRSFGRNIDFPVAQLFKDRLPSDPCPLGSICLGPLKLALKPSYGKFLEQRNLALYVELRIDQISPNAKLGIKNVSTESGFRLKITGGPGAGNYCLGGRDFSDNRLTTPAYFNLWLRGAEGSLGSFDPDARDPSCAGGEVKRGNFVVTKQSRISPVVSLKLSGGARASASGTVRVFGYVNSYKESMGHLPAKYDCPEFRLEEGKSIEEQMPPPEKCGVPKEFVSKAVPKLRYTTSTILGCAINSEGSRESKFRMSVDTIIPETINKIRIKAKKTIVYVPQCDSQLVKQLPTIQGACQIEPDDELDRVMPAGDLLLSACPASEKIMEEMPCDGTISVIDACATVSDNQLNCKSVSNFENDAKENLSGLTVNNEELDSSLYSTPIGFSFTPQSTIIRGMKVESRFSCAPTGSDGKIIPCAHKRTATVLSTPTWQRISGAPTENIDFQTGSNGEPVCGPFLRRALLSGDEAEEIRITGYPFSKDNTDQNGVIELADFMPKLSGDKAVCDYEHKELSIEKRLREYAALNGFPAAADPTLRFDFGIIPLNIKELFSRTAGCSTNNYLNIEGCPNLKSQVLGEESCGPGVDLGVFDSPPPACFNPGVSCRRVPETISFVSSSAAEIQDEEYAAQRATELGNGVIKRFLPDSSTNCNGSGCTAINVQFNTDKTVTVFANYEMPLIWPLKDLLRRDSVTLTVKKTERLELL